MQFRAGLSMILTPSLFWITQWTSLCSYARMSLHSGSSLSGSGKYD